MQEDLDVHQNEGETIAGALRNLQITTRQLQLKRSEENYSKEEMLE